MCSNRTRVLLYISGFRSLCFFGDYGKDQKKKNNPLCLTLLVSYDSFQTSLSSPRSHQHTISYNPISSSVSLKLPILFSFTFFYSTLKLHLSCQPVPLQQLKDTTALVSLLILVKNLIPVILLANIQPMWIKFLRRNGMHICFFKYFNE